MRTRTSLALIFSLIVCTALTSAADISSYPKQTTAYVNDFANIIDDATEKSLNETLKAYDISTTNEFIVATFPELKGNLEETTLELFRAWGIGKADKNNGLIFFVFVKDENGKGKTRIEVGKGLEGVLPDSKTKLIYEHDVRPFLVKHDFAGGIQACMTKLMQASVHEYTAAPIAAATSDAAPVGLFIFVFVVILIIVGVLFVWLLNSSNGSESQQKAAYKYERAASKPYTPSPKPTSTPSYGADRYSSDSAPSSYSTGAKVGAGVVGGVVAGGVAASLLSRKKPAPSYPSYSGSSTRSPITSSSGVSTAAATAVATSAAAIAAAALAKRRKEEEAAEEEEERRRRRRRDEDSSASSGWGGSSDSGSSSSWGSSDSSSSSSFDSGGGSCDGGGSSGDF